MKRSFFAPAVWVLLALLAVSRLQHHWNSDSQAMAQSPVVAAAPSTNIQFPEQSASAPANLLPEELANIRVYEVANRSVVNIDTEFEKVNPILMRRVREQGSGSGSVIDQEGHILTNAHVVDGARAVQVTLSNGETYPGELVGQDREHDIAVIKINAPSDQLVPLSMGQSDGLRVGQQVYALGNPFGLEGTLTKGIISSLNRSIEGRTGREMKSLIQTDAAMNPGNSGGPLLNSSAEMIGMNVAIATSTGQNTGVGFAIPANRIQAIVPELIQHGRIIRPDHGILGFREFTGRGIKIEMIRPESPAAVAGLRAVVQVDVKRKGAISYQTRTTEVSRGDWLIGVDGKPVQTSSDFLAIMDSYKPGQEVELTIVREGQEQEVKLTLGEG